jgi:hypothetical protein
MDVGQTVGHLILPTTMAVAVGVEVMEEVKVVELEITICAPAVAVGAADLPM